MEFDSCFTILTWLLVCSLSTGRLTTLVVDDLGPWCILESIRCACGVTRDAEGRAQYIDGSLAHLMSCFACASFWVALGSTILVVLAPVTIWFFVAMAAAQAATLIDGAT